MRKVTRKLYRKRCKTCGKKSYSISQHGNCIKCATEKVALSNLQMKHKEGPIYEKWHRKCLLAMGIKE